MPHGRLVAGARCLVALLSGPDDEALALPDWVPGACQHGLAPQADQPLVEADLAKGLLRMDLVQRMVTCWASVSQLEPHTEYRTRKQVYICSTCTHICAGLHSYL